MFANRKYSTQKCHGLAGVKSALAPVVCLALVCSSLTVWAQDQTGQAPPAQAPSQTQDNGKPKQDVPAEAGGPTDSVGPYAIPRKKVEEAPPPRLRLPRTLRTIRTTRLR